MVAGQALGFRPASNAITSITAPVQAFVHRYIGKPGIRNSGHCHPEFESVPVSPEGMRNLGARSNTYTLTLETAGPHCDYDCERTAGRAKTQLALEERLSEKLRELIATAQHR